MPHFADRFLEAVDTTRSYLTVGLDPDLSAIPPELLGAPQSLAEAAAGAEQFCRALIDGVVGLVPAVKPQSAFFEQFGSAGLAALERVTDHAREAGLLVLGDAKRGDIGTTMAAYATALLGRLQLPGGEAVPVQDVDAVTISPYLGPESLEPMLDTARQYEKGLFVLVRTSNPGSGDLQLLELAGGRRLFEEMAVMVAAMGANDVGERGFSNVGAVCGLTFPDDARRLRELMPHSLFLVPGLGPQGGRSSDFPLFLDDEGYGATVAASRAIASGWRSQPGSDTAEQRVRLGAKEAVEKVNEDLRQGLVEAGRWRW
jgi:orotidine-5'-phosphate decarboxylase